MIIETAPAATVTVPGHHHTLPSTEAVEAAARQMRIPARDVRLVDATSIERDGEPRTRFVFRSVWA